MRSPQMQVPRSPRQAPPRPENQPNLSAGKYTRKTHQNNSVFFSKRHSRTQEKLDIISFRGFNRNFRFFKVSQRNRLVKKISIISKNGNRDFKLAKIRIL